MNSRQFSRRPLALAVAALVVASGMFSESTYAIAPVFLDGVRQPAPEANVIGATHGQPVRYIVRFQELPLALYNDGLAKNPANAVSGIASIPNKTMKSGRVRLDVKSSQALAYVNYVKQQQTRHLSDIAAAIGQAPVVLHMMQHALNAAVLKLTAAQADKIAKLAGVVAVERDRPHQLATDIGPGFIGASSIWWGTPAGQDTLFANGFEATPGYRGDGMVIGDIDTGYNSMSPSFQATDSSGYTITNPLGSGNYIGQCNVANISRAGCNDKVIGVYDMINLTGGGTTFSVEDTQGHGSHTASTAAGDARMATLSGYTAPISGVAPHANLVIYYACSPDKTVACSSAATAGAADQAVADGIVDALNYSISGGDDPWNDATSLAFLAASDAGIFVAAAAGNTGASAPNQVPGTANHWEPWVATVAAGTHTGGPIGFQLSVNGAGAPGPIPLTPAASGTGLSAPATNEPIIVSPTYGTAGDACVAFGAGTFTGGLALLTYDGTCGTNTMAGRAITAGADYVLIVANTDGGFISGANKPKPVFTTGLTIGNALQAFASANSGTTGNISYPASRLPVQPDELADFSLLGPTKIDMIKPDLQAPGVSILAAVANDGSANGPNLVALYDGTSMATPHTTGSGALMLGLHPGWTPAEAKSALMMTAKEAGLTKADGSTPSDYFDRGSGRIQDFIASRAGLILNETGLNFANADPAFGGDVGALNIASMQASDCVTVSGATSSPSCAFTRKFRSTQDHAVTWTASFSGDVTATATPSSFPVGANANSQPIHIDVDATAYNADGAFHFGEMLLTPSDSSLTPLHLPMAIRVPPPAIAAAPSPLAIGIASPATSGSSTLTVSNIGGPTLNVSNTNDTTTAFAPYVLLDQASQGNFGDFSDYFLDFSEGIYVADDFQTSDPTTNLSKLVFPGFVTKGASLAGYAGNPVHFEIYADMAGTPVGNPETVAPSYVWNFVATIGTTAGLSVDGNTISIDLNAAGASATTLAPGRYWMVAYPETAYATGGWAQFESTSTFGYNAHVINPQGSFGIGTVWLDNTDPTNGDIYPGMAMHIEAMVPCGATWLSTSPGSLMLDGHLSAPVTVTADSTQFPGAASSASAYLCLDSNDAAHPVYVVPVTATVTP